MISSEIKTAMLSLMDEGFRIWENYKYVDYDGEEDGKNVWVVVEEGSGPLVREEYRKEKKSIDFFSAEEAVAYFLKVCGYADCV